MEFITILIRQLPVYIMGSIFFYKIFSYSEEPKYGTTKMIALATAISYITRIINSILSTYGLQYMIITGTIFLISNNFWYSTKRKGLFLAKGTFWWILEYVYEWTLAKIVGPWIWTEIDMKFNLPEEDFMKLVYVAILFIGFTIYDIFHQKRKETVIKYIAILNLITGSMQVFLLKFMVNLDYLFRSSYMSV